MDRCAVFVDAGYLFAQGSTCITGSRKPRSMLVLDAGKAVAKLKELSGEVSGDCRILRVYWYDGAIGGVRPTSDQALVAHLDDVKLRLGFINSNGQQKGVDSLIVTDLIELARLKSITDAILLSGDEDVRIGVQIAQSYGVRVHLLGIAPSRASQSQQLMQESDTTTEWHKQIISEFLSVRETPSLAGEIAVETSQAGQSEQADPAMLIEQIVQGFVDSLEQADIDGVHAYWETARGVPPDLDKRLLPKCGAALDRQLTREEVRQMRTSFQRLLRKHTGR